MWLAQTSSGGGPDWGPILLGVAAILTALKGWPVLRWLMRLRRPSNGSNGSYKRLEAENARLWARNEHLEQRLWRALEVEAENERLKEELGELRSRSKSRGSGGRR